MANLEDKREIQKMTSELQEKETEIVHKRNHLRSVEDKLILQEKTLKENEQNPGQATKKQFNKCVDQSVATKNKDDFVVGSYEEQNNWEDYDKYLMKYIVKINDFNEFITK